MNFEQINIGDKAFLTKKITSEMVTKFADLTGDTNLLHIDKDFSKEHLFKKPIAHGLFIAGFFSNLLGTKLPGHGTIYLSQTLKFIKPVYIDDTITSIIEVISKDDLTKKITFSTTCFVEDKVVLLGNAEVIIL